MNSVKPQKPHAHRWDGFMCFAIILPHLEHFLFLGLTVPAA